jgi:hypothetical protein
MVEGCLECERLWRAYAVATAYSARLDAELRRAGADDGGLAASVRTEVDLALEARMRTREAVREHEARTHNQQTRAF